MKWFDKKTLGKVVPYIGVLILGVVIGRSFLMGNSESIPNVGKEYGTTVFTCSMHPQVTLEKEGTCPICGMDLVSTEFNHSLAPGQFEMDQDALALANISTMQVSMSDSPDQGITLSGTIRTNEETDAIQTTIFNGRIEELSVRTVGDYLRKGQEFGIIYSPELYISQDKLLTSSSYKDTHVKLYEASRNGLGMWKLTDEQIDQLLKTREPILNFPMIADVTGTITEVMAKPGEFFKEGDPLFRVSNLNKVWAVFDAYENQLSYLSLGQEVEIVVSAIRGTSFQGTIDFIEPVLDKSRRTVAVRVVLDNRKGLLKPGMFADARVGANGTAKGIWIPKSAVLWTGRRSLVYRKPTESSVVFEARKVLIGSSTDEHYEILDGLTEGDEIVVNGTFTIDAAAQLNSSTSMMNPSKGILPNLNDQRTVSLQIDKQVDPNYSEFISTYLMIKDALVGSEFKGVSESAASQLENIRKMTGTESDPGQKDLLNALSSKYDKLRASEDIEVQRIHFKGISELMIAYIQELEAPGLTLYVQHCPMADNNTGADWLSLSETIENPYFGDKMLRCGKITQTIN